MKQTTILSITALVALALTFSSCSNDENPTITSTTTKLTATLNGAGEKPTSTSSTATGTFAGVIDESTRVLSYTVTYTGPFTSSLTAGHLHRITAADGTGGVEIPFTSLTSPIIGTFQLANQNRVDSLKNGFYYANLHTAIYKGGEIRGDIKKQ
ncbi:CHRD domain-containing protein [Spirosoma arboris]|uniref:CHRD domain-containing protein n=1 Tax=Spirosoma arboris TaxID=2682092 RepID=UPI0037445D03